MAYVVTARWQAKPGEEEVVLGLLTQVAEASRREPGCETFLAHRSTTDPRVFFLFERYASEEAFTTHAASDHVRRFVLEDAVHRLDVRKREMWEPV